MRHEFHSIGKFVVKVGQGNAGAAIPKLLIDASIVSSGGLRTDRGDVILLDQIAAIGHCGQDVIKRDALVVDAGLLDAFAEAEIELGSAEPVSIGGAKKVVGKGSARRGREAEESIVFKPAAECVIETVA